MWSKALSYGRVPTPPLIAERLDETLLNMPSLEIIEGLRARTQRITA